MDIFEFPDDYKPERPLTDEEMDDITTYLKNHPLFMKQMPEDISQNQHLVALQSMIADEDPIEEAQNLNTQGNNKLKEGPNVKYFMKEAYARYTQAINLKCQSANTNAKLHSNRAAINLKLKNYGKVIEDCKLCLKFNPEYTKGSYRYAKALIGLQRYKQCIELLDTSKQAELIQLKQQALKKYELQEKAKNVQKNTVENNQSSIKQYFKQRNWRLMKRDEPLPEGAQLQFINNQLSIPLMILYPEFKQFDLGASSFQNKKLWPYINEIVGGGLPWDTKNQYTMGRIEIYCEVSEAILMKIPKQVNIGEIAARVVIREALELMVISKDNQFSKFFLSQYKII